MDLLTQTEMDTLLHGMTVPYYFYVYNKEEGYKLLEISYDDFSDNITSSDALKEVNGFNKKDNAFLQLVNSIESRYTIINHSSNKLLLVNSLKEKYYTLLDKMIEFQCLEEFFNSHPEYKI